MTHKNRKTLFDARPLYVDSQEQKDAFRRTTEISEQMIADLTGADLAPDSKTKLLLMLLDHEVEMKQHIYETVVEWNEK